MTPLGAARKIRKLITDLGREDWHVAAAREYYGVPNHYVIEISEPELKRSTDSTGRDISFRSHLATVHVVGVGASNVRIEVKRSAVRGWENERVQDAVRSLQRILNLVQSVDDPSYKLD